MKKLNVLRLILVNIIIIMIFVVMLLITPNYFKTNLLVLFSYFITATIFNALVLGMKNL